IVERLGQELDRLVAKRFEEPDLRLVHSGNDGVATLSRAFDGAEEECFVSLDWTTKRSAELLAAERWFDGVGGVREEVRIDFGQKLRRVCVQLIVAEEA